MTVGDWATSGGVKIERAYKHIRDLELEIDRFKERHPYRIIREMDAEAREWVYRADIREGPPLLLGAIAGDVLHNLRSTLDMLWRQVLYPTAGDDDHTEQFPIFELPDSFQSRFGEGRQKKPLHKTVAKIMREILPYQGGNQRLWGLSMGNNIDKHRILLPCYTKLLSAQYDPTHYLVPGYNVHPLILSINYEGAEAAVYHGAIVHRAPMFDPLEVHNDPKPTLDIAFGERGPFKRQSMLLTLTGIAEEVERVAKSFLIAGLIK